MVSKAMLPLPQQISILLIFHGLHQPPHIGPGPDLIRMCCQFAKMSVEEIVSVRMLADMIHENSM
jgi:hypothetical protein